MLSGVWSDPVVNNTFILYFTGGFTIVFLMALIIAHSNRRKRPSVIVLKSAEGLDELRKSFNYCVEITTSALLGSSINPNVQVQMELRGTFQSCEVQLQTNRFERTILQRGCRDIFLVQCGENLGDINEVSFSFKNFRNCHWRISDITVLNLETRRKWYFPVFQKFPVSSFQSVAFHARCKYDRSWMLFYISRLWEYHQWMLPFHHPIKFGTHTSFSHTLLIGLTVSLLMGSVIIGYILSADISQDFNISAQMIGFTFLPTVVTAGVCWFLEVMLYNIKSVHFSTEQEEKATSLLEKSLELLKYRSLHDSYLTDSVNHFNIFPLEEAESKKRSALSLYGAFSPFNSCNPSIVTNSQGGMEGHIQSSLIEESKLEEIVVETWKKSHLEKNYSMLPINTINDKVMVKQQDQRFHQATESFISIKNQVDIPTSKSLSDSVIDVTMRHAVYSGDYSVSTSNSDVEESQITKKCHFQELHQSSQNLDHTDEFYPQKQTKLTCVKAVIDNISKIDRPSKKITKKADLVAAGFSEPRFCAQYLLEEINIALNDAKTEVAEKIFDGKKVADKINFWTQVIIHYLWKEIRVTYDHSSWKEFGTETRKLSTKRSIFHSGSKTGHISSKSSLYRPDHSIFQTVIESLPLYKKFDSFHSVQSWDVGDSYHFTEPDKQLRSSHSLRNSLCSSVHSTINILDTSDNLSRSLFKKLIRDVPYKPDHGYLYKDSSSIWSTSSKISETKEVLSQMLKPKQLWDEDPPDFQSLESYLYHKSIEILNKVVSCITQELPPTYLPASSEELSLKTNQVITEIDSLIAVEVVDVFDYSIDLLYNCGLERDKFSPSIQGDKLEDIIIFTQIFVSAVIKCTDDINTYEESLGQITKALVMNTLDASLYELEIELIEISILSKICSTAINEAKLELWNELQNTNLMYCQYLLKQAICNIKSDSKISISCKLKTIIFEAIELLKTKWRTQGVNRKFTAMYYLVRSHLASNLRTCNISEVKSFVEEVPTALNGLECQCQRSIDYFIKQSLTAFLSDSLFDGREDGFTELVAMDSSICAEYIEALMDHNLHWFSNQIKEIVSTKFNDFCIELMSQQHVEDRAVSEGGQKQDSEQDGIISLEDVQELISVVKPLKRYTNFLYFLHKTENNPIRIGKYISAVRRQNEYFTTVNIQNILDSYCMDEDNIPQTFTNEFLYNLENEVTGESIKFLPNCLSTWLKLFMMLCVFGMIIFTSLRGITFDVTQVQEWFCLYLLALIVYGFILEPLKIVWYSWAEFK